MIRDSIITHSEMINKHYLLLKVVVDKDNVLGLPGQFYQLQCSSDPTKLRVPISIYDIKPYDTDKSIISFIIKIVGEKTLLLQKKSVGEPINLIGPIGNHFLHDIDKTYLLVSGGCGDAPLHYFYHKYPRKKLAWFHGCKNIEETPLSSRFHTILTTDDGSYGVKGYVTTEVAKFLKQTQVKYDQVYACGPMQMLIALNNVCQEYNLPLQVSLEAYMACGVGVCHGCVVGVRTDLGIEYERVCTEGPIFSSERVVWK